MCGVCIGFCLDIKYDWGIKLNMDYEMWRVFKLLRFFGKFWVIYGVKLLYMDGRR